MDKKAKDNHEKKLSVPEIVTQKMEHEYVTVPCPEDGCDGEMFYTSYDRRFENEGIWQLQHVCNICLTSRYYEDKYPRINFFSGNRKVCSIFSNS